jgi:arylsulfatase A
MNICFARIHLGKSRGTRLVSFAFSLALAFAVVVPTTSRAVDTSITSVTPNIIFVLGDDVGIADIGCTGGPYPSPRINAMAQGGTQFQYCYATPLCGPSRCQILTGRYPFRTGLINNHSQQAIQPSHEVMIPTVLKQAGYVTASIGKWGQMSLGPLSWGFDEEFFYTGNNGRYWAAQGPNYYINGVKQTMPQGAYMPDLMHNFLVDFITRHKDQPFFVYYPMSHIHTPIVATPDSKPGATKAQLYADNIAYMDKLVGKLLDELDLLNLRQNTLVIFSGDNGTANNAIVDGRHIHGLKGTLTEGGCRVPCIVNWPGTTPAGQVSTDLLDFSDFFVTFAELAGAPLPAGVMLDGHSFAAQIRGQTGQPRDWVFDQLDTNYYVRDARWKLTNARQMYDLINAPWVEAPVAVNTKDPAAIAARKQLQADIDSLHIPY